MCHHVWTFLGSKQVSVATGGCNQSLDMQAHICAFFYKKLKSDMQTQPKIYQKGDGNPMNIASGYLT